MGISLDETILLRLPPDVVIDRIEDMLVLKSGLHKYEGQSCLIRYGGELRLLTRDNSQQRFWNVAFRRDITPRVEQWQNFLRLVVTTDNGEQAVLVGNADGPKLTQMLATLSSPTQQGDAPSGWSPPPWTSSRDEATGSSSETERTTDRWTTKTGPVAPVARQEPPMRRVPESTDSFLRRTGTRGRTTSPSAAVPIPNEAEQSSKPKAPARDKAPSKQGTSRAYEALLARSPRGARGALSRAPVPADTPSPPSPKAVAADTKESAPRSKRRLLKPQTYPPSGDQAHSRNRLVFVARVPRRKLALMSESWWLDTLTKPYGRGVNVAGQYWVCAIKTGTLNEAEEACRYLKKALKERYGDASAATWAPYDTPGTIPSGAPPPVVEGLIHHVQRL